MIIQICICDKCNRGNDDGVKVHPYRMLNKAITGNVPVGNGTKVNFVMTVCKNSVQPIGLNEEVLDFL